MKEIMNINGIDCYEKDGTVYLKLEAVARGLGFTETAASGNECIRWRTVRKHLSDLGIATSCDGSEIPDFIPENIFYRLAMKAKNEVAEKFQAKIADEVIPTIRRTGGYVAQPLTPAQLIAAQAQVLVDMEQKMLSIEQQQAQLSHKLDSALQVFSKPREDTWRTDIYNAIRGTCEERGLNLPKVRGNLYAALEQKAGCNLACRLTMLRNRQKKAGMRRKDYMELGKLDAIAQDKPLRAVFESIVREWKAGLAQEDATHEL